MRICFMIPFSQIMWWDSSGIRGTVYTTERKESKQIYFDGTLNFINGEEPIFCTSAFSCTCFFIWRKINERKKDLCNFISDE